VNRLTRYARERITRYCYVVNAQSNFGSVLALTLQGYLYLLGPDDAFQRFPRSIQHGNDGYEKTLRGADTKGKRVQNAWSCIDTTEIQRLSYKLLKGNKKILRSTDLLGRTKRVNLQSKVQRLKKENEEGKRREVWEG
jgi:hypothetical protein